MRAGDHAVFVLLRAWTPSLNTYTRVMLLHYAWHINVALVAVLGIVTAINVSSEITTVWAEGAVAGMSSAASRTSEYVLYRLLDNGAQVFPVAFVLGIIWAEFTHAHSGRQTMVRTAGMSFRRGATALIIAAAASIPLQFLLDNVVRPFAFMSLSKNGLGEYGWNYKRLRADRVEWLAFGNALVQVRLRDDPLPHLTEVTHYQLSADGNLERVVDAQSLTAVSEGGADWQFRKARVWTLDSPGGVARPSQSIGNSVSHFSQFETLPLTTPISLRWLEYRWIAPKYIPLLDLIALASERGSPNNAPNYSEWLQIRIAQSFTPGLVALLVSCIFYVFHDRAGLFKATLWMLSSGYLGLSLTRSMAVIADYRVLPAWFAVWALPVLLLLISLAFFRYIRKGDRHHESLIEA